jgi:hypothetical protein
LEALCNTKQDIDGGPSGQDNMLLPLENNYSDLFKTEDAIMDGRVQVHLDSHVVIQDADSGGVQTDENPWGNSNKTKNPSCRCWAKARKCDGNRLSCVHDVETTGSLIREHLTG